ncbi:MAG: hypothetical protein WBQ14_03630 [Gaiellaceae bacterium]
MSDERYLIYVWKVGGYELEERTGELPPVGSTVTVEEISLIVSKIAASPLPNDSRPCVYLQPA